MFDSESSYARLHELNRLGTTSCPAWLFCEAPSLLGLNAPLAKSMPVRRPCSGTYRAPTEEASRYDAAGTHRNRCNVSLLSKRTPCWGHRRCWQLVECSILSKTGNAAQRPRSHCESCHQSVELPTDRVAAHYLLGPAPPGLGCLQRGRCHSTAQNVAQIFGHPSYFSWCTPHCKHCTLELMTSPKASKEPTSFLKKQRVETDSCSHWSIQSVDHKLSPSPACTEGSLKLLHLCQVARHGCASVQKYWLEMAQVL